MLEMFYRGEINLSTQCKFPLKQMTSTSEYKPIFKRLSNALEKNLYENYSYCITTVTISTITVCSVLDRSHLLHLPKGELVENLVLPF